MIFEYIMVLQKFYHYELYYHYDLITLNFSYEILLNCNNRYLERKLEIQISSKSLSGLIVIEKEDLKNNF